MGQNVKSLLGRLRFTWLYQFKNLSYTFFFVLHYECNKPYPPSKNLFKFSWEMSSECKKMHILFRCMHNLVLNLQKRNFFGILSWDSPSSTINMFSSNKAFYWTSASKRLSWQKRRFNLGESHPRIVCMCTLNEWYCNRPEICKLNNNFA